MASYGRPAETPEGLRLYGARYVVRESMRVRRVGWHRLQTVEFHPNAGLSDPQPCLDLPWELKQRCGRYCDQCEARIQEETIWTRLKDQDLCQVCYPNPHSLTGGPCCH